MSDKNNIPVSDKRFLDGIKHTNRLIDENSPYLLSHAHNPVDWYPWGDEALEKARAEDKPIFLSIGYAACHWCHVMERESFENDEIAGILNEYFVSIKVDREQRPDVDHIYMQFTQALTGHGGWPMSVFLTPDRRPFFAGTYFPPDDQYGRPGFKRIVSEIGQAYRESKDQITESADDIYSKVAEALDRAESPVNLRTGLINEGVDNLMKQVDMVHGGFGTQPKFPHAMEISLLLRHYRKAGDLTYLQAAEKSLQGMAHGGIYDQIGGGFARYSVDARWLVPHFEKMLYDNGLLAEVYAQAYQVTGNSRYLEIVGETLDWLLREMTDESGGFYSALDADSEGEEGKFYVWEKREIENVLKDQADRFIQYYNVTEEGNFEGRNILHVSDESRRMREQADEAELDAYLSECRRELLEARSARIRPATDDKILVSWNGLALSALARGYQVTREKRYLEAAEKNASFVRDVLNRDGHLMHAFRKGNSSHGDFLEDYAFYIRGLIDLSESDPSENGSRWLEFAERLADQALTRFLGEDGQFYLRPEGQSDLIMRPRDAYDGALPAPGSVMIHNLFKLNRLTGKQEYLTAGERALKAVSGNIQRMPSAMTTALLALDFYVNDKIEVVVIGSREARREMLDAVYRRYIPNRVIAISDTGDEKLPLFQDRSLDGSPARAFVCKNATCGLPAEDISTLNEQLREL
jgi:uncharacterized protein YyaL (SSP411 family)